MWSARLSHYRWEQKAYLHFAGEDSLVHVSRDALPGDAFALSMSKVWEVIKSQKDLNLPAHKVSSTAKATATCNPMLYLL